MGKGWQLAVGVAFFIVGFARCFSLVFNSFLELELFGTCCEDPGGKKKTNWRILAYGLCSAKEA